jgi:hypothetical protein
MGGRGSSSVSAAMPASGEGVVTYTCNGSTENEFQVLGVDFDAACG